MIQQIITKKITNLTISPIKNQMNSLKIALFGFLLVCASAQFATNYFQDSFTNAAAAQMSSGQQVALNQLSGGLGLWGAPISATDFYANSFNNAAAAQFATGNTVAASQFAAPLGFGWGGYPVFGFPVIAKRYY